MTKQQKDLLVFGYGLVIILSFIATRMIFKHGAVIVPGILYAGAVSMLLITIFNQRILKVIYDKWMIGANFIGHIFSSLVLITLFYVVFSPIGLILRLMRKDLLDQKIDLNAQTYWHKRTSEGFNKENYTKQF